MRPFADTLPVGVDPTVTAILAILMAAGSLLGVWLTYRAASKKSDSDYRTALDRRIDERMNTQMAKAWTRIDELEAKVRALEGGTILIRTAVRGWFARLIKWDRGGRHGKLPVPTSEDMKILGIEDLAVPDITEEVIIPTAPPME